MKKEEKELVVKWLDKLSNYLGSAYLNENLDRFKADNDLIVKDELWNKWLVYKEYPKCMLYHDSKTQLVYGIDIFGEWYKPEKNSNNFETCTEATPEEIETKLSAMAEKMGYVEGVKFEGFNGVEYTFKGNIFTSNTSINCSVNQNEWNDKHGKHSVSNPFIMKDGIWAKITSTPNRELSTEE